MKNKFSTRIKELRSEKSLSRAELANFFNLKQNAVYEWEMRGKQTDYDTLIKIADLFDVSLDYLLGRSDY